MLVRILNPEGWRLLCSCVPSGGSCSVMLCILWCYPDQIFLNIIILLLGCLNLAAPGCSAGLLLSVSLSSSLCFMSVQVYKADSKTCWHRCSLSIRSPKIHRGLKTERDPANGEGEGGTIFKHTESDVGYLHSAVHPHCLSFCLTGRHKVMLAQSLWAAFKVWKMSRFEVWRGSRTTETGSARESLAIL